MNEELLKIAHEKLGGESVGSYEEFVKDFNSSEELRKMAHQKLGGDVVGTYDEFIKDSGFVQNPIEKKPNNPQDYFGDLFKTKETNSTFKAPAFAESEQIGGSEKMAAAMTATTNIDPTKRIEKRKSNSETRIKEQSQILYDNNKLLVDENTDELTKKESLLKSLNAARELRKDASNSLKDNHGIDLGDADKLSYKLSRLQKQLDQVQRQPLSPEQKELETTSINAEIEGVQKQLKDFGERVSSIPEYGYLVQSSNDLRELNKMSDQYFPELKAARDRISNQQAKTDKIAKSDKLVDDADMFLRYTYGLFNSTIDMFDKSGSALHHMINNAVLSGDDKKKASLEILLDNEKMKGFSDSFKPSSGQGSLKETYVQLDNGKKAIFIDGEPAFARDENGYKYDLTEEEIKKANDLYGDNSNVKKSFNGEALANNFIGTVFDMVPTILLTSVTGGGSLGAMTTIAATTAAQSFGDYYFTALEKGASPGKAALISSAKAGIDGLLENVGGLEAKLARGGVERSTLNLLREETRAGLLSGKIAKNEIYKYYAKRLGDLGLESAKQGVGEYAEETLQSLNQGLFDLHAYNDNSTLAKIPGDALETFLISFALGAGSSSLQGLTNFKAKTKDDIRYNSILAAIKNPDKLQEVSDLLSTEKYGTSKNSDENYMFIQTMADDIEALDIKEDKDKLRAIQILVEKNNLETSSKKDNAGSVAAKIRNKKIQDLEAELNDLGRNKIFEVKEEDRKPKEEAEEEDTAFLDAINRRRLQREAADKAQEESQATPQTVESLQTSLNPEVNPMDRFSDFDPDAAGLLPAKPKTESQPIPEIKTEEAPVKVELGQEVGQGDQATPDVANVESNGVGGDVESEKADIERRRQEELDANSGKSNLLNTPTQDKQEALSKGQKVLDANKELVEQLEKEFTNEDETLFNELVEKLEKLIKDATKGEGSFAFSNGKVKLTIDEVRKGNVINSNYTGSREGQVGEFEIGDNIQISNGSVSIPGTVTKVSSTGRVIEVKDKDGVILVRNGVVLSSNTIQRDKEINAKYDAELATLEKSSSSVTSEQKVDTKQENTTDQEQKTPQRTLTKTDTKTLKAGDIIDWNGADMEVTKVNSNGSVDAVNARYTPGNRKINGIVNSDSEYGGKVSKEYSDKGKEQFQAEGTKLSKEQNTNDRVEKVKAALKTLFPDLKIVLHNTSKEFDDQVSEESGRKGKSVAMYKEIIKDGVTTREIHLNLERLNSTSIYHEGTHPILDLLESIDPGLTNRLYDQLLELEKDLGIEGQFTKEFAKRYKPEDKKTEAIVEFIAHVADGKIDLNKRSVLEKIKSFFVELFKGLGINIRPKLKSIDDLKSIANKISEAFREGSTLIVDQNVINGKTETGLRTNKENGRTNNGQGSIERLLPDTLSPEEKQGSIRGGEDNAAATIITGSINKASQKDKGRSIIVFRKLVKQRENDALLKYAKENNLLIQKEFEGEDIGGAEHAVFITEDGKTAIKINENNDPDTTWNDLFHRIAVHNTLFPDVVYTLKGFKVDNKGNISAVFEQPFITGENAKFSEVVKEMENMGFKQMFKDSKDAEQKFTFVNEKTGVIVKDLHGENIIKSVDGKIHFIDPIIEFIQERKNNPEKYERKNTDGGIISKRFSQEEQRGITKGGQANVAESTNLGTNESASSTAKPTSKEPQDRIEKNKTNIKEYASEVISNRKEIRRLSEQEEQGRKRGGIRNVEATLLLATGGTELGQIKGREAQQEAIEAYAKEEGIWYDNIESAAELGSEQEGLGIFKDNGMENQVFIPKENPNVVRKTMKTTDSFNKKNENEVLDFLDTRISAHNAGIGSTVPYTVIGFGRLSDGQFVVITEQPHVQDARLATRKEIEAEMLKMGYEQDGQDSFGDENYFITDVNPKNVLVDKKGNLHFIDSIYDILYEVNEDKVIEKFERDNEQNGALKDVESTTKALNNFDENNSNKRNSIINDKPQEIYALSIGENPEDLSYMGKGDFGEAYETKNETIIKITSSPNEAEIAKSLIGKKGNYAEIYDVKKVGNMFIIHQEKLETDSDIEDKLQRVQSILEEQDLPIQYLGSIDYDELSSESKQEYDDLSKFISDLEDVNRIYRNLGIEASDVQDGNLGYDKNGKLKAFDLQDKADKTKASDVEADPIKSKNEVISEAYHNALNTTENKRTEYQNDLIEAVEQILSSTQFELEADKKQETLDYIKDYFENKKFTKKDINDFYNLHKDRFVESGISTSEIATYLEKGKIPDAITSNDFGTKEQPKTSKEKLIIDDILNIDSSDYEKKLTESEALHNNNDRLEEDLDGEKNKYIVTTHNLMLASMDQSMAIIYDEAQKTGEDFYDKAFKIFRELQATKSINAAIFGIRLSEIIKTELNKPGLSPAKAAQLKSVNKDTTRLLQKGGKEIARVLSLYRRIKTKSDSARVLILQNNDAVKKRIAEMEKELENMSTIKDITENDPYTAKKKEETKSNSKKKRKPIDALAQAKAKLKGKTNMQKATDTFKELMKKRPC